MTDNITESIMINASSESQTGTRASTEVDTTNTTRATPQNGLQTDSQADCQASTRAVADVIITCPLGLHARPAAKLVKLAQDFPCTITLLTEHTSADAQSILDILTLSASCGSTVTVQCEGEKALVACERITRFLENEMGDLPNG